MSAFGSEEAARRVWDNVRVMMEEAGKAMTLGQYIARVELTPGVGFCIEDLAEVDEHLTIWGDKHQLAEAVRRINPSR
jgi:hypothetical protein